MKKILVPCDFSETSNNALNYAVDMANIYSADMVLLHVNQIPVVNSEFGLTAYSINEVSEENLKHLKELANSIKSQNSNIKNIDCFCEIGNVTDVIVELSKTLAVDLTVMGISGHGKKLIKALFGSTAVSVSKHIESSLIIVPPNYQYKSVLNMAYACDYDKSIEANTSLLQVKDICSLFGSNLHVLHVVPESHELNADESEVDNFVEHELENSKHRTYILSDSNISTALIDYINNHNIDMIVIEPKKHSLFHNVFYPSITNEMAFNSPVPIYTIHR